MVDEVVQRLDWEIREMVPQPDGPDAQKWWCEFGVNSIQELADTFSIPAGQPPMPNETDIAEEVRAIVAAALAAKHPFRELANRVVALRYSDRWTIEEIATINLRALTAMTREQIARCRSAG